MPAVQDGVDYHVIDEHHEDAGVKRVIFYLEDGAETVDVHVYGQREDKNTFDRVGGTRLQGWEEDEPEGSVNISPQIEGGEILVRPDVEVRTDDPDAIKKVEYEAHDL